MLFSISNICQRTARVGLDEFEDIPLNEDHASYANTQFPGHYEPQHAAVKEAPYPRTVLQVVSPLTKLIACFLLFSTICAVATIIGTPIYTLTHPDSGLRQKFSPNSVTNRISLLLPHGHPRFVTPQPLKKTVSVRYDPLESSVTPRLASAHWLSEAQLEGEGNAAAKQDMEGEESGFDGTKNGIEEKRKSLVGREEPAKDDHEDESPTSNNKRSPVNHLALAVLLTGLGLLFLVFGALALVVRRLELRDRKDYKEAQIRSVQV